MQEREIREFSGGYQPEEFGKTVSARDSAEIADALERALDHPLPVPAQKSVSIREGMTAEQYRMANADISADLLTEFIRFLRTGPWVFCWDD
jgi:hypothetical protein